VRITGEDAVQFKRLDGRNRRGNGLIVGRLRGVALFDQARLIGLGRIEYSLTFFQSVLAILKILLPLLKLRLGGRAFGIGLRRLEFRLCFGDALVGATDPFSRRMTDCALSAPDGAEGLLGGIQCRLRRGLGRAGFEVCRLLGLVDRWDRLRELGL